MVAIEVPGRVPVHRQRLLVLMLAVSVAIFVFVAAGAGRDIVLAVAALGALVTGHAIRWELRELLVYRRGDDDEHHGMSPLPDGDRDVGPL